jgi:hypothetical protein
MKNKYFLKLSQKLLFLTILFCGILFSQSLLAQANYNPATGIFTYNYSACKDPCVKATGCEQLSSAAMAECLALCDLFPLSDQAYLQCRSKCLNPIISVNRIPVSFIAIIQFSTNPEKPQFTQSFVRLGTTSFPNFTITNAPIFNPLNYYCYRYSIQITYNDGTICSSPQPFAWICNF